MIWNSRAKELQCIPCSLFSKLPGSSKSRLSKPDGITKVQEKVGAHENSNDHKSCYIIWKKRQSDIKGIGTSIEGAFAKQFLTEREKWQNLFKRILDVVLFLGKRGLAFRSSTQLIGDAKNGNFLGLMNC